jgi:hypothetical protein
MQREFTVSTGMKVFYSLLGVGLIIFSIFLFSKPKNEEVSDLVYLLPLVFTAGGVLFIVNGSRRKVIIEDDKFINVGIFTTEELLISDIKGYRITQKGLSIESLSPVNSNIKINNYSDLGDSWDLTQYLKNNFKDLDEVDLKEQQSNILQDTNLGLTSEERQGKLNNAKTIAILYNVIGVIIAIVALIGNMHLLVIIAIVYPLLSVIIMLASKGLIKFLSNAKRSVYAFVFFGFLAPTVVLFVRSMGDYHLLKIDNLWMPLFVAGLTVFALLFLSGINKTVESVIGQALVMLVLGMVFSFGSITQVNCVFDRSRPQLYHAEVLGHHIKHGKSTSYYLYLTHWGPCHEQKEINVGSRMYANTNVGDTLTVTLKQGSFNIPWFEVAKQ